MFPKRTRFLKKPIGWEDIADIGYATNKKGKDMKPVCDICQNGIRVGKEDGKFFRFCPRCEIKLKVYKERK